MESSDSLKQQAHKHSKRYMRRRNAIILIIVAAIWLALDIATKRFFNSFSPGQTIGGPYADIFCFHLVHNTGAAWGIFGDMTAALGILSIVVCILLLLYLFIVAPRSSAGATFGLALVIAGGIGNAIDRFTLGYVVDFIDPVFIDFPVFNIADTGVTCGIIIFIIALIVELVQGNKDNNSQEINNADITESSSSYIDNTDNDSSDKINR